MINQVAKRYAEALFDLADEQNIVSDMYSEIGDLNKVIKENDNLYDVLRSPFVKPEEKKNLVDGLFKGRVSDYSVNFLKVLIDNQRVTELDGVVMAYKGLFNEKNNVAEGTVTTVVALEPEKISELEQKLSAIYNKSVKLENIIDEDILGGVLVRIGNEEIDGSVKSRLRDLKNSLSNLIS